MTFSQFLHIILARRVLVISVFLTTVTAALLISLIMPKSYEASATVMVDVRPDPVTGNGVGGMQAASILATQVDIIKSPPVSNKVVTDLHLDQMPELQARWQKEAKGKGDYLTWVGEVIGKGLEVKPSHESNVIDINYSGAEPAFASALANAYAKAYIDTTVQIRINPARQYADFFEERAKMAREKLADAQSRLSAAQKDRGIIASEERLDVENQRLTELATQLNTIRALRAEASSRSTLAIANPEKVQDVVLNPLVSSMSADLNREETKLRSLLERYGEQHPTVIEQRATISTIKERLRTESGRVVSSVSVGTKIADSRVTQAQAAYDAQRERVMKLKDGRNQLAIMEREVETAQKIYESLQARSSQTTLESTNSQSNIYLLSPATEPLKPSAPRTTLNVALAAVVGFLIALMIALGVEMFDHRVRSPSDVVQALDLPVIGILPAPKVAPSKWRLSSLARKTKTPVLPSATPSRPVPVIS